MSQLSCQNYTEPNYSSTVSLDNSYFSSALLRRRASQDLGVGDLRVRASSLEAPGLHDTNLNRLSTQTPSGQVLLGHINKNMRKFGVAHEM